jgi:hypothetical protein
MTPPIPPIPAGLNRRNKAVCLLMRLLFRLGLPGLAVSFGEAMLRRLDRGNRENEIKRRRRERKLV